MLSSPEVVKLNMIMTAMYPCALYTGLILPTLLIPSQRKYLRYSRTPHIHDQHIFPVIYLKIYLGPVQQPPRTANVMTQDSIVPMQKNLECNTKES